jgi:hypothetical protein
MTKRLIIFILLITTIAMALPNIYLEDKGIMVNSPRRASQISLFTPLKVYAPVNSFVLTVGEATIVQAKVKRSVISLFGNIRIKSKSEINGNVIAIFGRVVIEKGARIRGFKFGINRKLVTPYYLFFPLIYAAFILLIIPFDFFFRSNMLLMEAFLKRKFLESFIYGLFFGLMTFIVFLSLFLTMIGNFLLPLLIPLTILAFFLGIYITSGVIGSVIRPTYKEQFILEKVIGLSFMTILLYIPLGLLIVMLLMTAAYGSVIKNRFGIERGL